MMADLESARFITKLEIVGRELENLKIKRLQRHEEFLTRLHEIKERCDKVTYHRMQRLKTEGISIDISSVKHASSSYRNGLSKSATTLDIDYGKRIERVRSSESYRLNTPPRLQMELSFHSTEGVSAPQTGKQDNVKHQFNQSHTKYMGGLITYKEHKKLQNESDTNESSMKRSTEIANVRFTEPVDNINDSRSENLMTDVKEVNGQVAKQNFRRIGNKLSSVMKLINQRRHTVSSLAPTELRASQVQLLQKQRRIDDTSLHPLTGSQPRKHHVMSRSERNTRIRLYSDGSDTSNIAAYRKLRRVSMTIRGIKQRERK